MKLALFADLHSNLEAITACLARAQSLGVDRYAFLGDLVGYGANPVAVLDLIEHHVVEGAVVVLGNHDGVVLGRPDDTLSSQARTAIAGTRAQLGEKQHAFLAGLPLTVRDRDANIFFVHASAATPEQWRNATRRLIAADDRCRIACVIAVPPAAPVSGMKTRRLPGAISSTWSTCAAGPNRWNCPKNA